LFPKLPEDAQAEAARHISNLLPDQNYSLLDQLLTNSNLPDSVLDALMSEAMDRPDALKLPLFLEIARNEMSPKAEDARAFLETFLQQDYGQDWPAWQAGINNWLAQEAPN
jgi:hypothetical protein